MGLKHSDTLGPCIQRGLREEEEKVGKMEK